MKIQDYAQNGGNIPVFRGIERQKGYGLGNIFQSLYRWFLPIVKTHGMPILKQGVGAVRNEALKTVANIANDALAGKEIKEAAKDRTINAVNSLVDQAFNKQKGQGIKRKKKKLKNHKSKKLKDIFD